MKNMMKNSFKNFKMKENLRSLPLNNFLKIFLVKIPLKEYRNHFLF